jgi:hypothetical protein
LTRAGSKIGKPIPDSNCEWKKLSASWSVPV